MNAIQKRLKKIGACKEGVEKAGEFRTAKEAWHGWRNGEDLLWLLVALGLPKRRLRAAWEAYYANAAVRARAAWAAEDAGVMFYEETQAAVAKLVRRAVPWEEVRELWEKKTARKEG